MTTTRTQGITSRSFRPPNSPDQDAYSRNAEVTFEPADVRREAVVRTDADLSSRERAQSTLTKPARRK